LFCNFVPFGLEQKETKETKKDRHQFAAAYDGVAVWASTRNNFLTSLPLFPSVRILTARAPGGRTVAPSDETEVVSTLAAVILKTVTETRKEELTALGQERSVYLLL
jgi:hypothetical protein